MAATRRKRWMINYFRNVAPAHTAVSDENVHLRKSVRGRRVSRVIIVAILDVSVLLHEMVHWKRGSFSLLYSE